MMAAGNEAIKRCPSCGEIKPVTAFSRNAARRRGIGVYCQPCHAVRQRQAYDRSPKRAISRMIQGAILAVLRHGPMTPDEIGTKVRNKTKDRSLTNRTVCQYAKNTPGVERFAASPRGSIYALAPKIDAAPPPPVIHPKVKVRLPPDPTIPVAQIERADPWFAALTKEAETRKARLNMMRSRA